MERASGVFLHPTSLPSAFGIGDLGENAYRWIDCLAANAQRWWQTCPLGPTGYGDSPYQCLSSFAGNTLLISPKRLVRDNFLCLKDLESYPAVPESRVDFGAVISAKSRLFEIAHRRFEPTDAFVRFCADNAGWLDNYALFMAIKELRGGAAWNQWEAALRLRFPASLDEMRQANGDRIRYYQFLQYVFFSQWDELKRYANTAGVRIIGDIPYYVALDSADAWAYAEAFEFNEHGEPARVAGVPPDYFSETGQLWGNPLYRWDTMAADRYAWWKKRIRAALRLVDLIRIDHFRGFESFWAVPADHKTAIEGRWEPGPGLDFFTELEKDLGALPLIAEDLGDITTAVEQLRNDAGLPGMSVLQFAFDGNKKNPYLPYNTPFDSVVYTGTHDNNTSVGWFGKLTAKEKRRVCDYIGGDQRDFMPSFLRAAFGSPAELCIVPLQDILYLDGSHRMNTPGTRDGNWAWRFTWKMLDRKKLEAVKAYTRIYGRRAE